MILRILLMLFFCCISTVNALAGAKVDAVYPYNLQERNLHTVEGGSTMPLYLNIMNYDNPAAEEARIEVLMPQGFTALPNAKWHLEERDGQKVAVSTWNLPAYYGQSFDLLYLRPEGGTSEGEQQVSVKITTPSWQNVQNLPFTYKAQATATEIPGKPKVDASRFNWYIQSVTLPVDNLGHMDDRAAEGVIYVRDTTFESFRNRMTGEGATNWSAVFNHPATHVMLEMRNPQKDVRMLKFKAQLIDKETGKAVPGLITSGKVSDDSEHGWAGETGSDDVSTALISLDGKKNQTFILPLYVDYFTVLDGDYMLRVTVSGNGQEKVQEVPLTIAKKNNLGLIAVGFSFLCFVLVCLRAYCLPRCIERIGAKGAISVALFAALAFGGITLPTTFLGDLLHVFLGPFSGFLTGVLSGILQYLLIVALLVLFRAPGVLSLMFFVKYMLSGLMLGHFTPLGLLSMSVYVAVLETVLYLTGFYKVKHLTKKYMLVVAVCIGLADAAITFVNLEQMMFFYRLYYADWYLALYMLINGLLYSSIGAWLGYRTGTKLKQVLGE